MYTLRRRILCALCFLLCAALMLPLFLLRAGATAADDQEFELLGELASRYEGGDAGAIVNNSGDIGGKSYGAYQFASASGGPMSFAQWCQKSENEYYRQIGQTLEAAYYDGGAGYGNNFDTAWKKLAEENYDGFLACQRYYVNAEYYHSIVDKIAEDVPGFDIHNYSIALRNVFLARAIQHGTSGARQVINNAFTALGGFANQPETDIIAAIYAESSSTRFPAAEDETNVMTGTTAQKYGVDGQLMHYYRGSSPEIQLGVFLRLRINEPARAQHMLVTYGYTDALLGEGFYQISPAGNGDLAVGAADSQVLLNGLDGTDQQSFLLTYYASGYYTVVNAANGLRLTALEDGSVVLAEATVDNNQFWKLEGVDSGFSVCNRATGTYLCAAAAGSVVSTSAEVSQWQLTKTKADWSLDGAFYPTYANILTEGESNFPFRGILRCNYIIDTVKISVLNEQGGDAFSPAVASGINANAFDLSDLDKSVAFSRLKAGNYQLVIEATSAENDSTFLLESSFFVTDGTHTLTFDACGGTVSEPSRNLAAGQAFGELPTAELPGHFFIGWFTAPEGGEQVTASTTAIAEDQTVYARYEKAYTYVFRNYDGTDWVSGQLTLNATIPAPAEAPTRPADDNLSYYTFVGWEGYAEGMTISQDVVFTALFERHEIEYLPEITTEAFVIRDGYLRSVAAGTTASSLLEKLVPSEFITLQPDGTAADAPVATGMTVAYTVNGELLQTLTIVVTGDVNGDGKISGTDIVQLRAYLLGNWSLSDISMQAADLNGDGKVSGTDIVQLRAYLLGKHTIVPN